MSAWRKARFERVMRRSSQAEAERVTGATQTAALPKIPHFNKMSINEHRVHFRSLYLLQGRRARQTARKSRFFKKSSSLAKKNGARALCCMRTLCHSRTRRWAWSPCSARTRSLRVEAKRSPCVLTPLPPKGSAARQRMEFARLSRYETKAGCHKRITHKTRSFHADHA